MVVYSSMASALKSKFYYDYSSPPRSPIREVTYTCDSCRCDFKDALRAVSDKPEYAMMVDIIASNQYVFAPWRLHRFVVTQHDLDLLCLTQVREDGSTCDTGYSAWIKYAHLRNIFKSNWWNL